MKLVRAEGSLQEATVSLVVVQQVVSQCLLSQHLIKTKKIVHGKGLVPDMFIVQWNSISGKAVRQPGMRKVFCTVSQNNAEILLKTHLGYGPGLSITKQTYFLHAFSTD
jgi:hypothetical protein